MLKLTPVVKRITDGSTVSVIVEKDVSRNAKQNV